MTALSAVLLAGSAVFLAALLHGLAGFGAALVAMPLLSLVLNVKLAAPLVALLTLTLNLLLLARGRRKASPRKVLPLAAGAAAGVPLGALFLARAAEGAVMGALGSFLVLYALFAILRSAPPKIPPGGGLALGILSGALGGAFNTGGPPAVVYVSAQRWTKEETYASLQLYFSLVGALVVASHAAAGLTTAAVLKWYALTLPPLAAGGAAGFVLHRRVTAERYRTVVCVVLLLLGASMVLR